MKCLHIQLQPELYDGDALQRIGKLVTLTMTTNACTSINIEQGDDDGPYINVNIETTDLPALWQAIESETASDDVLAAATIICSEGDDGWNDPLLLHHYDKTEALDSLK